MSGLEASQAGVVKTALGVSGGVGDPCREQRLATWAPPFGPWCMSSGGPASHPPWTKGFSPKAHSDGMGSVRRNFTKKPKWKETESAPRGSRGGRHSGWHCVGLAEAPSAAGPLAWPLPAAPTGPVASPQKGFCCGAEGSQHDGGQVVLGVGVVGRDTEPGEQGPPCTRTLSSRQGLRPQALITQGLGGCGSGPGRHSCQVQVTLWRGHAFLGLVPKWGGGGGCDRQASQAPRDLGLSRSPLDACAQVVGSLAVAPLGVGPLPPPSRGRAGKERARPVLLGLRT